VLSFLDRPLDGEWPYLWLDATYIKVRQNGRIVSIAAIIATGVNQDGRREILGLGLGQSEAATFWIEFLRGLVRRGLKGVKLVISDAHEGLKAAITQVLSATWQRCRVHFMRSLLAYVPKSQQTVVSAAVRQVFVQPDRKNAGEAWRHVADQLRPRFPKVAALLDDAEHDVLAYMDYPEAHRSKLHSTNPIERLNKEVKRRPALVQRAQRRRSGPIRSSSLSDLTIWRNFQLIKWNIMEDYFKNSSRTAWLFQFLAHFS
jgi:putative transposase